YNLMPVLTAVQNVALPLLLTNLSKLQWRERAETALPAVGLENWSNHYPRQLSGGHEQRVAIARAIVSDPSLLVADEPTGDHDREKHTNDKEPAQDGRRGEAQCAQRSDLALTVRNLSVNRDRRAQQGCE